MRKFKKILGWTLLVCALPLFTGLLTIDGEFCYHGKCEDVVPFFGGALIGLSIDVFAVVLIGFGALIIYLLNGE